MFCFVGFLWLFGVVSGFYGVFGFYNFSWILLLVGKWFCDVIGVCWLFVWKCDVGCCGVIVVMELLGFFGVGMFRGFVCWDG